MIKWNFKGPRKIYVKVFFFLNNQTDKDYFLKYYTKPKSQDNIVDFNHINVLWFCMVKHNKQSHKSNMAKGDHIDNLVLHTGKKLISSIWNPTNLKQKDQPYRTNGQMI